MTSSVDSICKKRTPSPSDDEVAHPSESVTQSDLERHVSPVVAHELNNILAIVQGYADRLLIVYAHDSALQSQLKMITEAARRAATIIRDATPQPQPEIA
jgi:signal transduction histidine kinase